MKQWFLPENLKQMEYHVKEKLSKGLISEDLEKNDFGAYYALRYNLDVADKWIQSHNMTTGSTTGYLKNFNFSGVKNILDVGCGAGYITAAIKNEYPVAAVYGIDISEDAVAFAAREFPNCNFICKPVDKDFSLGIKFDVIHVREFYPFTRTNDYIYMKDILKSLLRLLEKNGTCYVICATDKASYESCLIKHKQQLVNDLNNHRIIEKSLIKTKVIQRLGNNIFSKSVSFCMDSITKRSAKMLIISN